MSVTYVASADDPRLAEYRQVGNHRWLLERGLFVAEGRLVVQRLLVAPPFPVRSLLVTPAAWEALAIEAPSFPVLVAPQDVLNGVTGFNFHRGCLALAERPPDMPFDAIKDAARILVLEGVGNPDNVGGLFRVAAAFGIDAVLLDPASGDPLYRKAVRTSMGAALQVPFWRAAAWPDALDILKRYGFEVLALSPSGERSVREVDPPERFALVAGAEGPGISPAVLSAADARLRIPMAEGVDSLNVTVAVGIALSRLA